MIMVAHGSIVSAGVWSEEKEAAALKSAAREILKAVKISEKKLKGPLVRRGNHALPTDLRSTLSVFQQRHTNKVCVSVCVCVCVCVCCCVWGRVGSVRMSCLTSVGPMGVVQKTCW